MGSPSICKPGISGSGMIPVDGGTPVERPPVGSDVVPEGRRESRGARERPRLHSRAQTRKDAKLRES